MLLLEVSLALQSDLLFHTAAIQPTNPYCSHRAVENRLNVGNETLPSYINIHQFALLMTRCAQVLWLDACIEWGTTVWYGNVRYEGLSLPKTTGLLFLKTIHVASLSGKA